MKDIVDNRRRIDLGSKLRLARIMVQENGLLWPALIGTYYLTSGIAEASYAKAASLRAKNHLPGANSTSANKYIWENWNWSARGEEWTLSSEWKASIVRTFLDPYFSNRSVILEVGPGAGRWTEYLLEKSDRLIGVDVSETSVQECERRFHDHSKATFEVGNGENVSSIVACCRFRGHRDRVFQEAGGKRCRGASSVESSRSRPSAWCANEA
jgi:hypothetical protein